MTNHQVRLAARPVGLPKRSDWGFTEEAVPEPAEGEMLVKVKYLSLDPAMRGWMNEGKSYIRPVRIGEVMRAGGAGTVVASRNPAFREGDPVVGGFGVQEYAISDGKGVSKVDTRVAPLPVFLDVLGMPGMTAYFGLLEVGKPRAGETVVVSGAAGAVGSVVGQIAKIQGCRVVGIAGGVDKCRYLIDKLGFDAAIDYKAEDVRAMLKATCPEGIHVFFDNVGGDILEAALARLALHARVVICGAISLTLSLDERYATKPPVSRARRSSSATDKPACAAHAGTPSRTAHNTQTRQRIERTRIRWCTGQDCARGDADATRLCERVSARRIAP